MVTEDQKMGAAIRRRRRIQGDAIQAQSMLFRSCSIEKLSVQCSCKKHRGLKLTSINNNVIRKNVCPITWWLACLNPGGWDTMKERQEWQNEHPLPKEDWKDYVNELVEDI